MAVVEGLFVVTIAIVVIAGMLSVSSTQYDIIDTFSSLSRVQLETSQEDVDLNIDSSGQIYIKNKSPTSVRIVEMRVLNDAGELVALCPVDMSFSGGEAENIANFAVNGSTAIVGSTYEQAIRTCVSGFDGN